MMTIIQNHFDQDYCYTDSTTRLQSEPLNLHNTLSECNTLETFIFLLEAP